VYGITKHCTTISYGISLPPAGEFIEKLSAVSIHDRKIINSVQKALDILELFNAQIPELGTTEIAKALDIPKSTASGLVHTLETKGYLEQNPGNRKFRLGLKLLHLGRVLLDHLDLRQVAQPHLEGLRDWCNEGVNLAILDEVEVVYIERLFGTSILGMRSEIGKRAPVYSTALGKAILSCWSDQKVESYLRHYPLHPVTPRTITNLSSFITELHHTREVGYALDDQENELGGRCVAAPILDYNGRPVAAISISAPVQRLPDDRVPVFGEKVKQSAQAISRQIGGVVSDAVYHNASNQDSVER